MASYNADMFHRKCQCGISARAIATGFALMIPGLLLPALHDSYLAMLPAFALPPFDIGFVPPLVTAIAMRSVGPERGGMVSTLARSGSRYWAGLSRRRGGCVRLHGVQRCARRHRAGAAGRDRRLRRPRAP
ncbi:MFS transporter [Burkholderia ubonensis]|uniref:MFS transporter n=1 Tax=Burkholderia ubonensis TaxID=101571 RepID=UPI001178AB81|nr:MFS transporter [Burkholderia ubonensis]